VSLTGVGKRFGPVTAVEALDLEIREGEFLTLLGPSGCGKTTVLRLLAGFEPVDGGALRFDGRLVSGEGTHLPPEERRVGMVFQSYALWPHLDVAGNVAYALKLQGLGRAERGRRVEEALAVVGLGGYGGRRVSELSGGQRQRVALARCLAMRPALVLLDEPLANLDPHLRETMVQEFRRFHAATSATTVYVTHDQAEAMALADRVAVLDAGRLQQVAPPRLLYAEPATPMVARFVGRGRLVPVEVQGEVDAGRCRARLWGLDVTLRCPPATPSGPATACLRAADLRPAAPEEPALETRVAAALFQGETSLLTLRPLADPDCALQTKLPGAAPAEGEILRVAVADGWVLPRG